MSQRAGGGAGAGAGGRGDVDEEWMEEAGSEEEEEEEEEEGAMSEFAILQNEKACIEAALKKIKHTINALAIERLELQSQEAKLKKPLDYITPSQSNHERTSNIDVTLSMTQPLRIDSSGDDDLDAAHINQRTIDLSINRWRDEALAARDISEEEDSDDPDDRFLLMAHTNEQMQD